MTFQPIEVSYSSFSHDLNQVETAQDSDSFESIIDLRPTELKLKRRYTDNQALYNPEIENINPMLKENFPASVIDENIFEMSFQILWSDASQASKEHLLAVYNRENTEAEWKLMAHTEFTTITNNRSIFVVTIPFQVEENSTQDSFYKFSLQTGLKPKKEVIYFAECRKGQLLLCCENGESGTLTIDLKHTASEQLLVDKKVGSISIFMENILRIPRSPALPLLKVFSSPIQQTYQLVSDLQTRLRVHESLSESPFTSSLPCKLLGLFINEERDIIQELESLDLECIANTDLNKEFLSMVEELKSTQIDRHRDLLEYYADVFHELNYKLQFKITSGEGDFRRSPEKKNQELQWLPLNCCIQKMKVEEIEQVKFSSYSIVTCGVPCAHAFNFHQKSDKFMADIHRTSYYTGYLDHTVQNLKTDVRSLTDSIKECVLGITENILSEAFDNSALKKQLSELKFLANETRKYTVNFLDRTMFREGVIVKDPVVASVCEEVDLISYQLNEESLSSLMELIRSMEGSQRKNLTVRVLLQECLDQIQSYTSHIKVRLLSLVDYFMLSIDKQHTQDMVERKRDDVVLSQAITTIATGFVCMIDECLEILNPFKSARHQFLWSLFWERLEQVGFLCQFESLLSPYGPEYGMLCDTYKALREIERSVKIGFHAIPEDFKIDQALDIFGYHGSIVISVGIPEIYFAKLNPPLQNGFHVSVKPVLFTQGINEQQALANMMGDFKFQDKINAESYERYHLYLAKYKHWWQTKSTSNNYVDYWAEIEEMMAKLKGEIDSISSSSLRKTWRLKTTMSPVILQLASELTSLIGSYPQPDSYTETPLESEHHTSNPNDSRPQITAYFMLPRCSMRYTMCKSAKDRTSMSVTLEQTNILRKQHQLSDEYYHKTLKAMREECGVRLANIERNFKIGLWEAPDAQDTCSGEHSPDIVKLTLQDIPNSLIINEFSDPKRGETGKYAFNFWQLYFFPEEYRPVSRVVANFQT
ncbi:Type I inositol 3,4-bisphosphate 4-phosphatase [Basidiobolus ranarum]|uniref:Type I inositol 3,4-bisphosphate 4-phosphatase n=1 Tax=Basidiobolus ranarum TaxID=34480 RepID=A0ABR2WTA9_9FUNG